MLNPLWLSNCTSRYIPKGTDFLLPGGNLESPSQQTYFHWERQGFSKGSLSDKWHPTPVFLPGKSHRRRSLVGCSPWGRKESDTTEQLHFHFSLSCVGEGNGNHSSTLAWRIPGTTEPGELLSMGSHRVRQDWCDLAAAAAVVTNCTAQWY